MVQAELSIRTMQKFVATLAAEVGQATYSSVLSKSGLPRDWREPDFFASLDQTQSAEAYSKLQSALRLYYGRGARGILLRIGTKLWEPLLKDAPFSVKTQASVLRGLPKSLKRKPALDILAGLLSSKRGDVTVHTLDTDLLVVDQASPATLGQKENSPICFVTLGLIRECLYWAVGEEHDIEEQTCRAAGAPQCEFKITIGA